MSTGSGFIGKAKQMLGRGAPPVDAGFRQANGLVYLEFLASLHQELLFDWYLEVGCRHGDSFAPVRGKTIAVDPYFRAELNIIGKKPALHVFQATSDDFFASGFLARNDITLGLSFLDGMHLYEFLLRDFMHTEAASGPDSVIMMHDCIPFNHAMLTRDLTSLGKGPWTGDVWKIIPILQKWRPELKITVFDCYFTGLVCISNLQPGNRVLQENYDAICAEYDQVDLAGFGVERFFDSFAMTNAAQARADGFQLFKPASIALTEALDPKLHST